MLKIAVCDDEKHFQKDIKGYISRYLRGKEISFEVDVFSSGKEFLELGSEIAKYDISFLDINMSEVDGIKVAKQIRKFSKSVYIVFVTAYINYSLEGYKVEAIRYILKNNQNLGAAIAECFDAILEKMNEPRKNFKFCECEKEILLDDIVYVESKLHKLEVHIMEEHMKVYSLYAKLNEFEKEVENSHFLRLHQSFLINLKYLKSIKERVAVLDDKTEIIIPRARYKDVKTAFVEYKGEL